MRLYLRNRAAAYIEAVKLASRGELLLRQAHTITQFLNLFSDNIRRCLGFCHARNFELDAKREIRFYCYVFIARSGEQKSSVVADIPLY